MEPSEYVEAEGKMVRHDSVLIPGFTPTTEKLVKAGKPEYITVENGSDLLDERKQISVTVSRINTKSTAPPEIVSIQKKKTIAGWPQRQQAQLAYKDDAPFAYLNVEQNLHSPFVFGLLEDRLGRIWIGFHDGTLGVWDGRGIMYYTPKEGSVWQSGLFTLFEDRQRQIWIGDYAGRLGFWNGNEFISFENFSNGRNYLVEDRAGRIWIGNSAGAFVWDGQQFKHYTTAQGLADTKVCSLLEDRNGSIWLGGQDGSISVIGEHHITRYESVGSGMIIKLLQDRRGWIWIAAEKGLLVWDGLHFYRYPVKEGQSDIYVGNLLEDRYGNIWMASQKGLYVWDPDDREKKITHYSTSEGLSSNAVVPILEDRAGRIWIGTNGGGINISGWQHFNHHKMPMRLPGNIIISLLEDRKGHIWIGTQVDGVYIWDGQGFANYTQKEGLLGNSITGLVEDEEGRVWIGIRGGGVSVWNPDLKGFTQYDDSNGLRSNKVWSMSTDKSGRIWVGINGEGVDVWDPNSRRRGFTHIGSAQGLASNNVFAVEEDAEGRIWLGTYGGVSIWSQNHNSSGDIQEGSFLNYDIQDGLGNNRIWSIIQDESRQMWIGSNGGGANVWNGSGFFQYDQHTGLTGNIGRTIFQDKHKNIWIGTYHGLNRLIPQEKSTQWRLQQFLREDGLSNISIHSIIEDNKNQLWLGTSKGISRLDLNHLQADTSKPNLFIREIQPSFRSIDWRMNPDSLVEFDSVISGTNLPLNPSFPHHMSDLSISWSGVHSAAQHQLKYIYFLQGNDSEWSPLLQQQSVRYQNLDPGQYTFRIKAVGKNGRWSKTAEYVFSIRTPWWQRWWAYSFYTLCAFTLAFGIYRFLLDQQRVKSEARRLQELDNVKTKLYTNITHEFRTPLTVIKGVTAEISDNEKAKQLIQSNSDNLLQLINKMLDLAKIESGSMSLHLIQDDIILYCKYLTYSFQSLAVANHISLIFDTDEESLIMDFDRTKVQQILTNLLSNAIKFTPEYGNILVKATRKREKFRLIVEDSGIGIAETDLPYIFDRFQQIGHSDKQQTQGTGIGLALVKELVKLMNGNIEARSELAKGSTFTIHLPIRNHAKREYFDPSNLSKTNVIYHQPYQSDFPHDKENDFSTILIIEDNLDITTYLQTILQHQYKLSSAKDGETGIQRAIEIIPDIVISDVMMPEKDGYEVVEILKTDPRTSHIPIILLTAKADQKSKEEGLSKGADAYLTKPFSKEELYIRLEQLIRLRKQLQIKYQAINTDIISDEKLENDPELTFLKKLDQVIENNLHKEQFKINPDLCRAMTMSKSQLYRKVSSLTGISPSQYLQNYRLKKARQLLLSTQEKISVIAETVGIMDPSYFSRIYQKIYLETPSETRKNLNIKP